MRFSIWAGWFTESLKTLKTAEGAEMLSANEAIVDPATEHFSANSAYFFSAPSAIQSCPTTGTHLYQFWTFHWTERCGKMIRKCALHLSVPSNIVTDQDWIKDMKKTTLCQGCWEQMHLPVPIRGPFSIPLKLFGIKQTKMHPNLCTVCELMFTKVKKQKQIPISTTILFADLRGYTSFSQKLEASRLNDILNCFYDHCSSAVWEKEGIVNKFIGDAVLAIFNFPLERADHVSRAVSAGVELQKRCIDMKRQIGLDDEIDLGVGVGIHTGTASIGEIGTSYKEFTAIGPVVNLASRVQGYAQAGEIVVTEDVYNKIKDEYPDAEKRSMALKGIDEPVDGYVLDVLVQR